MATFYVGQRVRVVCPESKYNGCETRILAANVVACSLGGAWESYVGSEVDLPSANPRFAHCIYEDHELEPVLPSGHRACDDDFKRDLDRLLERRGVTA